MTGEFSVGKVMQPVLVGSTPADNCLFSLPSVQVIHLFVSICSLLLSGRLSGKRARRQKVVISAHPPLTELPAIWGYFLRQPEQ